MLQSGYSAQGQEEGQHYKESDKGGDFTDGFKKGSNERFLWSNRVRKAFPHKGNSLSKALGA